jgi:hypothetical protein
LEGYVNEYAARNCYLRLFLGLVRLASSFLIGEDHTMATNYVVDYRIGGELMCKWRRVLGSFPLADAQAKRDELNRMGYAAIVQSARSAAALGLPVGWRAASVDWERDRIIYGDGFTEWASHTLLQ